MKNIYQFEFKGIFKRGLYCFALFSFAISSLFLSSCSEEEGLTFQEAGPTVLTANTTTLELLQKNGTNTALNLAWTPASNQGTNAAIDYTLQIDKKGNEFSAPKEIVLARTAYAYSFKGYEINNVARKELGIEPHTTAELEFRIKATPAKSEAESQYSEVVPVTITPYEPVSPTLYIIGDATPTGWSADDAIALQILGNDSTSFRGSVALTPGNYKFITTQGQFLPSYNKGADDNSLVYRTEDDQPDDQFVVTEAGLHIFEINLSELTISVERIETPAVTDLWVVGGAVPKGWDLDNADKMFQDAEDPFVFTYTAVLNAGEFKIATEKDWGAAFYRPTEASAPITSTEVQLSAGEPDHKWLITDPGAYNITLDLNEMNISFELIELYLIGDAGPNGWDIGNPAPMTRNGGIYTYTGPLTAGELKISKFKGDWCNGDWLNSATPSQAITDASYITTTGCDGPDNKWVVTAATAGDYIITIDLSLGNITMEKQ